MKTHHDLSMEWFEYSRLDCDFKTKLPALKNFHVQSASIYLRRKEFWKALQYKAQRESRNL
ncbi:MAG: hypothetical protein ACTSX4_10250 [Candidatus Helarchaeota archaeon]